MSKLSTEQVNYITITDIDLTTAHTDTEYVLPGVFDTLVVESLTGSLSIRLNNKNRGSIDLTKDRVINANFDRFFYTNAAQAAGSVTLQIGADASFAVGMTGIPPATWPSWFNLFGLAASQVTTAAYVVYGQANYWRTIVKATIVLRESGAVNGALYQIQGTLDGTNWVTLKTDVLLPASGIAFETISDPWVQLQINIKDAIAASHATVVIQFYYETIP